jgi:hypothetical protein
MYQRIPLLILFLLSFSLSFSTLRAQPAADTTVAKGVDTLHADPARHRVLWMETGSTAPKGRIFIGIHEFLAARVGYAPFDFLQADFTYIHPDDYKGIGVKARIVPPVSILRGLSVRAALGSGTEARIARTVQTYGGALSLGSEKMQLHLEYSSERRVNEFGTFWQKRMRVGGTLMVPQDDPSCMQSINAEALFEIKPGNDESLETIAAVLRTSRRRFVWEIGVLVTPRVSLSGDGAGSRYPFPYFAASWYI